MSSSGLIYAVIVGAWAAYLVPMWLRRQDELNEVRPTERFGTAIRLLSGRAGMERRYARNLPERREASGDGGPADGDDQGAPGVDVRALADPVTEHITVPGPATVARAEAPTEVRRPQQGPAGRPGRLGRPGHPNQGQKGRAKLLARRRRTTMVLFLAFTLGAIVAAVGGIAFLWAPAIPAGLLSAYIAHMRAQERRRFEFVMDRRHAEDAARHLRERRTGRAGRADRATGGRTATGRNTSAHTPEPAPEPASDPEADERRALVEQTDHAEWVDAQRRERTPAPVESGWEPTPVPLPTYVNAPVAPRTARGVDLEAPDAWSSARSTTASSEPARPSATPAPSRSSAPRRRTPLFDQYADEDRPRAANE
ncbi:hypothetical protein IQ279_04820 [Streptomyces verrucosisporus]|uniref:divisome protein SepX/GlpR n=1 Tax=Streptomyces verrucosisporus TaxID=1695161 RepID=UPI0019D25453|nr:gephyrin-like molybdotransferase receptor GlpR [Streptomyces verrucosisporus]MBN3928968.1 hypothetical protein [Streptomyces verrucosisporus]